MNLFGYISEEDRTEEQNNLVASMIPPELSISGNTVYTNVNNEKKICITDLWKHPVTVAANGFPYPGIRQVTGSCVGAGGGNAIASLAMADAIIRKEAENPLVPFWLLPYGRSRFYLYGRHTRGDGSTGATFARAVREDGVLWATKEGLPKFQNSDGLVWGRETELNYSTGQFAPEEAKKYLVKDTALCRDHNAVRDAICNYYPVTCASRWGGNMRCQVEHGVLMNQRTTTWSHQMSILAWWEHPQLGEIFWIHNQWGLNAHGTCPSGQPQGGFWVRKQEVDWICRAGETFAFSQYSGFPAQQIVDWYI
jgi:hypothetical protein